MIKKILYLCYQINTSYTINLYIINQNKNHLNKNNNNKFVYYNILIIKN